MKITDYEKVQSLAASNIFLLDGPNGTKTIAADALAKALIGSFKFQRFYRRSKSFPNLPRSTSWYLVTNYSSVLRTETRLSPLKMHSLPC